MTVQRPALPKSTAAMDLRMSGLLFAALGCAVAGLHSILMDSAWWFAALGVVFVVLAVAAATRYYSRRTWVGTAAGALAGFVVLTLFFGAGTAFLGIVPTGGTFARFGSLAQAATDSIARQSVPAFATVGIQFLLCWTIGGIAVVLDAVAISGRMPALTGIPLFIVLAVPSFVRAPLSDAFLFELTAVAYLFIVRNRLRRVQPGVAIVVGTIAVLGALIVPAALPPVTPADAAGSGIGVLAESINPIINLGADLRNSNPVQALSYTTTSSTGEYLRLTTLSNFSGKQWAPATPKLSRANTLARVGDPPGLTTAVASPAISTNIQIGATTGQWLPTPYPATKVTGLTGTWLWQPGSLAIRSDNSSMQGQKYSVLSLDVEPTIQQLQAAGSSASDSLAAVPKGLDPIVAATARKVVAGAKTDFDKAVALQSYFRGGTFTYSTKTPAAEGYDGSGIDVIAPFLQAKEGYCVHFASAMAVMARTLGIPSRVAVGFLPGKPGHGSANDNGPTVYTVSSADMHAWPELYFAGVGWVRFEPTPSKGFEPNFPSAPSTGPSTGPVDPSTVVPSAPAVTATPNGSKLANDTTNKSIGPGASQNAAQVGWGGVSLVVLLLLLASPAVIRVGIRRRRIDRIRLGDNPAGATWEELRESARDLGFPAPSSQTPQQLSGYLAEVLAVSVGDRDASLAALKELRELVEDESYGPPAYNYYGERMADALLVVLRGLRRSASLPERLRALLLPATLVDRALGRAVVRG
jgi:transglutaminase-like putative cysteine protease